VWFIVQGFCSGTDFERSLKDIAIQPFNISRLYISVPYTVLKNCANLAYFDICQPIAIDNF